MIATVTRASGTLKLGFAALAIALAASAITTAQAEDVVVFAAASMKGSLDEAAAAWKAESGKSAKISYAASSALAKQIESGAPADVFISADLDWMNELATRTLIKPDTRSNLLGNQIVLVGPKDTTARIEIAKGFDLAGELKGGKLAMADPASVPAGKYGKAALQSLGAWHAVEKSVAPAENVRAALALVSRGEAPLGIVYATDAAAEPGVRVIAAFPAESHPPIVYPVAVTASSTNPDAAALVEYLHSAKADAIFEKQGFSVMN